MTDTISQDIIQAQTDQIVVAEAKADVWQEKYNAFVSKVAKLILSPEDEVSVLSTIPKYIESFEKAEEFKVKFEKEVQARKKDYLDHQEEIEKLQGRLDTLSHQFSADIQAITDKYESRIKRLENQLEASNKQALERKLSVKTNLIDDFFKQFKKIKPIVKRISL